MLQEIRIFPFPNHGKFWLKCRKNEFRRIQAKLLSGHPTTAIPRKPPPLRKISEANPEKFQNVNKTCFSVNVMEISTA
jgi:hypothetical protein